MIPSHTQRNNFFGLRFNWEAWPHKLHQDKQTILKKKKETELMCPRLKVRYSLIFWFSADFIKCLVIASFKIVCGICLDKWVQLHKYLSHSQPSDYLSPDARLKKIMKHMCTRLPLASQIKINAHLAFWRPTKIIEKQSFMGGERQKKKDGKSVAELAIEWWMDWHWPH